MHPVTSQGMNAAEDPPAGEADAHVQEQAEGEAGSYRRCIITGESLPLARLIRFVQGPDGAIVPDVARRLPGRGLWLTAERGMIDKAASGRAFAKAARGNVKVAPDLADTVAELLRRRCLNTLGLARRAGLVAAGAEKVRAQIATGRTIMLLEAADGSPEERRKLCALAPHVPVVDAFAAAELGAALGRDAAVHVGLASGGLTASLSDDAARYQGVKARPAPPDVHTSDVQSA
jgi:predicted RNA-binding protein YlxR (DUF448 family)